MHFGPFKRVSDEKLVFKLFLAGGACLDGRILFEQKERQIFRQKPCKNAKKKTIFNSKCIQNQFSSTNFRTEKNRLSPRTMAYRPPIKNHKQNFKPKSNTFYRITVKFQDKTSATSKNLFLELQLNVISLKTLSSVISPCIKSVNLVLN